MIGDRIEVNIAGGLDVPLPRMVHVRQKFALPRAENVSRTVAAEILRPEVRAKVKPGMTTLDLDTLAETHIRDHGGIPNFQLVPGYRHTLCTGVNDAVLHGMPGDYRLVDGDLLSLDLAIVKDGVAADAAISFVVGNTRRPEDVAMIAATERALAAGIRAAGAGARVGVVSHAI